MSVSAVGSHSRKGLDKLREKSFLLIFYIENGWEVLGIFLVIHNPI